MDEGKEGHILASESVLYEKYEELLKEHGCRTADVCRETGLNSSMFSHWKDGLYTPKIDKLAKIAKHFDVPVTWFIDQ